MGIALPSVLRVLPRFTTALLMLCGFLASGDASAWLMFPRPAQETSGEPWGVAVGDLNNDGHMDSIATALGSYHGWLHVYLGHGDGTFTVLEPLESENDNAYIDVAVADFDHDGNLDAATADFDGGILAVRMGNGDGTFGPETAYPGGAQWSVSVGDFNGDGNPDVLGMNGFVLLGDGSGGFMAHPAPGGMHFAGVADLDGDGLDDYAYPYDQLSVRVMGSVGTYFVQKAMLPVGEGPVFVAAGDVSGDGLPDLVVCNEDSYDISVLLGNGDGTFAAEQRYSLGDTGRPYSVAIHDLDGDGLQDLVVGEAWGNPSVILLYGTGGGGFSAPVAGDGPFGPCWEIALADFNGDGAIDLFHSNWDDSTSAASWLFGDGNGAFIGARFEPGGSLSTDDVATADLDGDGRLDLITTNADSDDVSVLLGNGAGTFAPEQRFCVVAGMPPCPVSQDPSALVVGELTGDAHLDLAVTNERPDTVSILAGDGAGGFSFTTSLAVNAGMDPISIAMGDLDNDDDQDLVVVGEGSIRLRAFLNNGDGTFVNPPGFFPTTVGTNPTSIALGQIDGDGILDAAVLNRGSYDVSVLLGDGDGNFTHAPTLALGGYRGAMALGDVNGDQLLDIVVSLDVFLGNGDGTFGSPSPVKALEDESRSGSDGNRETILDINGDGEQDVILAGYGPLSVYLGDGTGVFDEPELYYLGGVRAVFADFNLDSRLDVAGPSYRGVIVLLALSDTGAFGFEADGMTLRWPAVTGALSYNLYRGDLSSLVDGDGDGLPDGGYGSCMTSLDEDPRDTFFEDATVPTPAGAGFFYLMSVVDSGGDGGIGTTSAGLPRAPGVPCP